MKNLIQRKSFANVLMLAVILTFSASCVKTYKASPTNPYGDTTTPSSGDAIPVINTMSPNSGLPNTVIKLSGNNFDQTISNNKVTINGVTAVVDLVQPTAMYITVPANATSGPIVIASDGNTVTTATNFKVLTPSVSTLFTLPGTKLEHLSFNLTGDLIGESTNTVYQVSPTGVVSTIAGGDTTFMSLWGSVINPNLGDIYVTDRVRAKILRISSTKATGVFVGGASTLVDGRGTAAGFGLPIGLAMDPAGNLYTTDSRRVRMINTGGLVTTLAGNATDGHMDGAGVAAQFGSLQGIAADAGGNIYVSDRKYLNIRKIDINNTVTTLAGSGAKGNADGAGTAAQFVDPVGLAMDGFGDLLVADGSVTTGNYAIRMINKFGVVTTLLSGASLNQPDGMTTDPQGNIYISNTGNNTITKITFK